MNSLRTRLESASRPPAGILLLGLLLASFAASAAKLPDDSDPPGSIAVYPPTGPQVQPDAIRADSTPELIHYKFNSGVGTSVPNLASSPPPGTATATIMGGVTQNGADLNAAGNGFSLRGTGVSSTTDFLNTGWATNLSGTSWTISVATSNIPPSSTLFYIFGDVNAGSLRCFTNGVAGPNNWLLRGPVNDVLATGGATLATHRTTFVYDTTLANIRAYVDGVLVNTVGQAPPVISSAGPFKFGGYASNVGSPANGLLDDFRVYNRALTAAEVADLDTGFNCGSLTPQPVGQWGTTDSRCGNFASNTAIARYESTVFDAGTAPFRGITDYSYEVEFVNNRPVQPTAATSIFFAGSPIPLRSAAQWWDRAIAFNIAGNGKYSIFRYNGVAKPVPLQAWTVPVGVVFNAPPASNLLRVDVIGPNLEFRINGVLVRTLPNSYALDQFGMGFVRSVAASAPPISPGADWMEILNAQVVSIPSIRTPSQVSPAMQLANDAANAERVYQDPMFATKRAK